MDKVDSGQIISLITSVLGLLGASWQSIVIKLVLMGAGAFVVWMVKKKIQNAIRKSAAEKREVDYEKDKQENSVKNEQDNIQLNQEQANVDDWAEKERNDLRGS